MYEGTAPASVTQPDLLPPMTAEAARRLAAELAPHLVAMRAVTAGTRYAMCADGLAAVDAATATAAEAQLPPVSAATTIFIAGMLERISA
ncbi:MAG TPA: hypothetical protein VMA73_18015 [Streptosporangiaceae bacterium]|nr:hypothetical protein [Streptosporangiaceae bacterium]